MASEKDWYNTIVAPSEEILFKEKGSKFFGYAFPVTSEEDAREAIEVLQKQHYAARHHCYAWQLGDRYEHYRVNDDGEPSNSAGAPIYGQIQAFSLTNVLVVVVRYFGGTKLGVGGLIQAYKTAAKMALESSHIVKRTINQYFIVQCDYPDMNTVMRILKSEKLKIVDQKMELNCRFRISVRERDAETVFQIFKNTHKVNIKRE